MAWNRTYDGRHDVEPTTGMHPAYRYNHPPFLLDKPDRRFSLMRRLDNSAATPPRRTNNTNDAKKEQHHGVSSSSAADPQRAKKRAVDARKIEQHVVASAEDASCPRDPTDGQPAVDETASATPENVAYYPRMPKCKVMGGDDESGRESSLGATANE